MEKNIKNYLEGKATHTEKAWKVYSVPLRHFKEIIGHNPHTTADLVKFKRIALLKYDPNNVAFFFHVLKNYCGYLRAVKVPAIDPFMVKAPRYIRKQRPFVTESDMRHMIAVLNEWEYHDLTKLIAIQLLYCTGMRASELCDLNLSDVTNKKGLALIRTKKSKRFRYVAWTDEAHELLVRYLGVRLTLSTAEPLFIAYNRRITTRTLQRWVRDIKDRARIEKHITPHSFRHGKAHRMKEQGADVLDIKHALGHASILSVEHYIRLDADESLEVSKKYM